MKIAVGVVLCAATALAVAETRAERGKRVVDEALQALGGNAFLEMKDRIEDGRAYSFYRDRLTGLARAKIATRYVESSSGPVKQRERQAFGKDEDQILLFNEKGGYEITFRGAKPVTDERFTRYVDSTRRNIFYILRHRLQEPGLIIEGTGTEVWQNNPVEVVDITDADNNVITVYFHRTSKVPIRQVYTRRNPETRERDEYSSVFSKYRDVGGVQWPYNMLTERNGEKIFEMFSDSVVINQTLGDEYFMLSAKIKMLPKEKP